MKKIIIESRSGIDSIEDWVYTAVYANKEWLMSRELTQKNVIQSDRDWISLGTEATIVVDGETLYLVLDCGGVATDFFNHSNNVGCLDTAACAVWVEDEDGEWDTEETRTWREACYLEAESEAKVAVEAANSEGSL